MASNPGLSDPVEAAATAAEQARRRVTATMDDIQYRLDPRRIVADTVERLQASSKAIAAQAGETAKAHPVALGTAAAALGLALLARNRLAHATINIEDGARDYTDYDDGYGEEAAFGGAAVPSSAKVQALAGDARNTARANPGVSIVVGLIAGAVLGALLPTSETERRALGVGSELDNKVRGAARSVLDAAQDGWRD